MFGEVGGLMDFMHIIFSAISGTLTSVVLSSTVVSKTFGVLQKTDPEKIVHKRSFRSEVQEQGELKLNHSALAELLKLFMTRGVKWKTSVLKLFRFKFQRCCKLRFHDRLRAKLIARGQNRIDDLLDLR